MLPPLFFLFVFGQVCDYGHLLSQLPSTWTQLVELLPVLLIVFRCLERQQHLYSNCIALCWMQFQYLKVNQPDLWNWLSENSLLLVEEPGEVFFSSLARTVQPDTSKDKVQHLNKAYLSLGVYHQYHQQFHSLVKNQKQTQFVGVNQTEEVKRCVLALQKVFLECSQSQKQAARLDPGSTLVLQTSSTEPTTVLPATVKAPQSLFSNHTIHDLPRFFQHMVNLMYPTGTKPPPSVFPLQWQQSLKKANSDTDSDWEPTSGVLQARHSQNNFPQLPVSKSSQPKRKRKKKGS